jgi:glycerol-3-phosphate O-acyltransferase
MEPLLAHGTLRPFVESYLVVAEALLLVESDVAADAKAMTRYCMALARERALQGRIASEESAAKVYLENGLQLARSRGLIGASIDERRAHHDELLALAGLIAFVAGASERRRFGTDAARASAPGR